MNAPSTAADWPLGRRLAAGGFIATPTPEGVPVASTSPGSSVITVER